MLIFNIASLSGLSQAIDIENDHLMDKYLTGKLTQIEFRDICFEWREVIDSVGYPDAPYDPVTKKVEYTFLSPLDGISRETIVNRVSEWAAVSFGSTDGLLTHQGNTSRLIVNGSIEVLFPDLVPVWKNGWVGYVNKEQQNSSLCYFTLVFTIKEGKMKSQVLNIFYAYTDYVGNQSVSRSLDSCFPITRNEKREWKPIINLVNETTAGLYAMIDLLNGYIRDYENDYDL